MVVFIFGEVRFSKQPNRVVICEPLETVKPLRMCEDHIRNRSLIFAHLSNATSYPHRENEDICPRSHGVDLSSSNMLDSCQASTACGFAVEASLAHDI